MAEALKSMLTEKTRNVNPKYGRQSTEFNAARFLMFSNHDAALPLLDNDRRIIVIENPAQPRAASYYARMVDAMNRPGFGAAARMALRRVDISDFNPGERAPMNAAKGRVVRAGRSEVEQAVRDIARDWPSDCIRAPRLVREVELAFGVKSDTRRACVAAGLAQYGRVRIGGSDRARVWVLRDVNQWLGASAEDVAAEVRRGELAEDGDDFGAAA
jgi:hypothetical protein